MPEIAGPRHHHRKRQWKTTRKRRHGGVIVAIAVSALVGFVIILAITRPWLAFIDVRVDETLPSQAPVVHESAEPGDNTESPRASPLPVLVDLASGSFISHEHETTGTVRIIQHADGTRVLAIKNLSTTNGPDVRVWLSTSPVVEGVDGWSIAGGAEYVDLGPMKGNLGNQLYDIPAEVDLSLYKSVALWCLPFSVSFGAAQLIS